jgi:transposase InsO family protein
MFWYAITLFLALLVDLVTCHFHQADKDLEILLLKQQLRILERKLGHKARINRGEKCVLAVLAVKLLHKTGSMRQQLAGLLIFKPETVLKWHQDLVRRKWTFKPSRQVGRPATSTELRALVIRIAKENDWGYDKIKGELQKLGYPLDRTTVKNILRQAGILPAPERRRSLNWRTFLKLYKQHLLACDFFTVETLGLQTLYVLFFIEIGSRRVHLAGCTSNPTSAWVTQQARQLCWQLDDQTPPLRFLIHDRDTKFPSTFDAVFQSEGIEVIRTPYRTPNANAFAERWVRSVREECLNHLLIVNERHLRQTLKDYVAYYNTRRPHQGLDQQCPISLIPSAGTRVVRRRDILGGIVHDYYRQAA